MSKGTKVKKVPKTQVPQRSRGGRVFPGDAGPALRTGEPPPRLLNETDSEYACFVAFWRKGAAMSARAIARELGQTHARLGRLRKRLRWDARVQAATEETPEVKQSWADRRAGLREEEWALHRECLAAGREALRQWQQSGKVAGLGDVVKLLEFAAKLARLAAGMPDSHTEISGEDGKPIRLQFEAALAQAYGPVVDVVAEVVERAGERTGNDNDTGKIAQLRNAVAPVEGGQGGGAAVCRAPAGGLRTEEGQRPDGGHVREDKGAVGAQQEPGI